MKIRVCIIIFIVIIVAFSLILWTLATSANHSSQLRTTTERAASAPDNSAIRVSPKLDSVQLPTIGPPTAIPTNEKVAAINAYILAENAKPQDFYGKVIDQNGDPVAGAVAVGTLMQLQGFDVPEKRETLRTHTDANGEFEFVGIRGWQLAVAVEKKGFEMGHNPGVFRPAYKENSAFRTERALFRMWKVNGAEPMIHKKIEARISCDGSPITVDLLTGQRAEKGGDLTLSLTRKPLNIDLGKPFDWSLKLTVAEGGLIEITDYYPNQAPMDGYESVISKEIHAGPPHFTGNAFDHSYYFKSRDGKVYGRMKVHIQADYQPPPTRFEIEVFANPAGSRNLEYDPKQGAAR